MSTPPDKVPIPKTATTKLDAFLKKFGTEPSAPFGNEGHTFRTRDFVPTPQNDPKTRGENLSALLASSPDLKADMRIAFEHGLIDKIEYLPSKTHAGGMYDKSRKSLQLPLFSLDDPCMDRHSAAECVFMMGHEVKHAINSQQNGDEIRTAFTQARNIAASQQPVHDYTPVAAEYIRIQRLNEASANIAGFNALVSKVQHEKSGSAPSLAQLYNASPDRMGDFIERVGKSPAFEYRLKDGLTVDENQRLPYTKDNIEASGRYYFDKLPKEARLGKDGTQDYRHFYCDQVFWSAAKLEKQAMDQSQPGRSKSVAPTIEIDLKRLGLRRDLLTANLDFIDSSQAKSIHAIAPDESERLGKKQKANTLIESSKAAGGAQPSSPLYAQSLRAIDSIGANNLGLHGRTETENVAAAMALQALKLGMHSVDDVIKNPYGNLIACEGDPKKDSSKRFVLDVQQAKMQPAVESLKSLGENLQKTEPAALRNEAPPRR